MKSLLVLLGFIVPHHNPVTYGIHQVRTVFEQSAWDERAAKTFLSDVEQISHINLLNGYKGAVKMIMARHYLAPWNKYISFREGRSLLDEAIRKDEQNTELIYLRFCIQTNIPSFLNYHHHIQRDKDHLLKVIPSIKDRDLKNRITRYLMQSTILSNIEKQQLSKIIE